MDPTRQFITRLSQAGGMTRPKLRRLKARRWKYPLSIERQYTASISRYLSRQWKEYAAMATRMMVPRSDAVEDLSPVPGTTGPALGAIINIASSLDAFNRREMEAFRKIAVGEAFQEDEPWVKSVIDTWSREQVSLITKASQDMRDAVARRVRDGVKRGLTGRDIEKTVMQEMPGISFRRARVIARDQASKLNASLTQGRMADAGLSTYIWDTAQDERVRGNPGGKYSRAISSHWEMQGKICRWDDPTVCLDDSGEWVKRPANAPYFHPGMAIMCRCVALPNWQELEGVKDSGLPAVEPVAMPAAVEPTPAEDDSARVDEFAGRIADLFVKRDLLQPDSRGTYVTAMKEAISRLPEGWRKAWLDTAAVTKIRTNRRLRVSHQEVVSGDVVFSSNRVTTVMHGLGHATMARLTDHEWLERMYSAMEAKGGLSAKYAQSFRNFGGGNFKDRAAQVQLGMKIKEEWLDGFASSVRTLSAEEKSKAFEALLSEHGVSSSVTLRSIVNDWIGLGGDRVGILGFSGHPSNYRNSFRSLAMKTEMYTFQEAEAVALSVEAGAEFMELVSTEGGLKFLQTFLPNTLEFFNKEVIGL